MVRSVVFILTFLFASLSCLDSKAFEHDEPLMYSVRSFLDTTNTLTPEMVLNGQHKFDVVLKPNNINFGHTDKTAWLLVKIDTPVKGVDYIMTLENAHLDTVSMYVYAKGDLCSIINTGDHLKFDSRILEHNMFAFTLPDSCDFFLLRINSKGSMNIPLSITTVNEYIRNSNANIFLYSLFYGVLLLAFVINILLYFRVAEKIYFYYVLTLISSAIISALDVGYLFQYVWPTYPVVNNYTVVFYAFSIFMLIFSQQILSLKENSKKLNKVFTFFVYLMLVAVVLNIMGYYHLLMSYLVYYFYAVSLLYLFSGFYIYFVKKYKPAFFYMLAWSVYAVFIFIYVASVEGLVSSNFFTQNAFIIGNMLEIILLFLAVIDKIYEFRKAKDEATVASIRLMEENRVLLFEQNLRLEQKVKERTNELEELNCEIQAQNEELNTSQDQLAQQNEIIQKQNRLLSKKKNKLKRIVKKRTEALEDLNDKLINKNNILERFGYFTAHNIRGPVSSIMGLANLFKMVKDNPEEFDKVVVLLKQSSDKLDEVVRDMITLLDFNNSEVIDCTILDIDKIYLESKELFLSKLPSRDVLTIKEDFVHHSFLGDPVIGNFVFDQLFENSYKFRDINRKLEISVEEKVEEDFVVISFTDNGIGFDSEKFDKDLFGLYKKFHTSNFSGKGLGLYFVKEYMNRMGGDVTLFGTKGVGTTVTLSFRKTKSSH